MTECKVCRCAQIRSLSKVRKEGLTVTRMSLFSRFDQMKVEIGIKIPQPTKEDSMRGRRA